jgi:DNA-directed RNA polymerase subunit alpha
MYRNWTDLIKPKKLEVDEKTLTSYYGKFSCEPLERGFGQTIGNGLRRTLLSSLMGAAITSVRFKGVLHEFSTITGITEDVTDIILNIKEVRLRLHNVEQETLKIEVKGPKTVYARDIMAGPNVEILNPDQHIATLSREGELKMEMVAKIGRGYVPVERNKDEGLPVDTIFLDAVFFSDPKGQLSRDQRPSRAKDRLRSASLGSLDRRQRQAGRCRSVWGENSAGSTQHLHQF